jgi:peptidoglycan hydrolase-like protein with peptidoglycan-binding domain
MADMLSGVFEGAIVGGLASYVVPAFAGKGKISNKTRLVFVGVGAALGVLKSIVAPEHKVGQLPQSLPPTGLPGQFVYNIDPRRDPGLDPISRERLYPAWLLAHWQNGDAKIIMQLQQALGVAADGVVGQGTSAAIQSYQARVGLPVTGVMDYATMQALILG